MHRKHSSWFPTEHPHSPSITCSHELETLLDLHGTVILPVSFHHLLITALSMSREVELGEPLQYTSAVDESQLLRSLVVTISRLVT